MYIDHEKRKEKRVQNCYAATKTNNYPSFDKKQIAFMLFCISNRLVMQVSSCCQFIVCNYFTGYESLLWLCVRHKIAKPLNLRYLTAKTVGEAEEDTGAHSSFEDDGWIFIGRFLLLLLEYNSRTTGTVESVFT